MHGRSPEIIEKYIPERGVRPQVSIVLDSAYVVEDEAALTAVVVGNQAGCHYNQRQQVLSRHLPPASSTKHRAQIRLLP